MNVHVVVSTMNGEFSPSNYPNGDYEISVINQGSPIELLDDRFNFVNIDSLGLARSRNVAISIAADDDILVFTDNDVSFCAGFEQELKKCYEKDAELGILTFKALNSTGKDFKENYRTSPFSHNLFSVFRVSSIEISVKKSMLRHIFDVRYGLGSEVPIGEENIFLYDNVKCGVKSQFLPISLVTHNDDSHTGLDFSFKMSIHRFRLFSRCFGRVMGTIVFVAFIAKNARKALFFRRGS